MKILIILLVVIGYAFADTAYKNIDNQGEVIFSDKYSNGATELNIEDSDETKAIKAEQQERKADKLRSNWFDAKKLYENWLPTLFTVRNEESMMWCWAMKMKYSYCDTLYERLERLLTKK